MMRSILARGPRGLIVLAPLLAAIALGGWALASPVGASPDDDFHLASSWCGLGDRPGLCERNDNPESRSVPTELVSSTCFAFVAEQSAECQDIGAMPGDLRGTDRLTLNGNYPALYYVTMGIFAGPNVDVSVLIMRLFNILLFVGLTTALFVVLPRGLRPTLLWAWMISVVPLGLFIISSNNPSSWLMLSAGSLWIALVGYLNGSGRQKIALGAIAIFSAVIGLGARSDAPLYTCIGVAVALLVTMRRDRRYYLSALLPVGIIALAVGIVLAGNAAALVSAGLGAEAGKPVSDLVGLVFVNLLNVPLLWLGIFGAWPLGWVDTELPGVVGVASFASFAGIAFAGLRRTGLGKSLALVLVGVAIWAVPTYVLVQNRAVVGSEVQPRYLLPLIVILAGLAVFTVAGKQIEFSRTQIYLVIAALTGANAVALYMNMRRYLTGVDVVNINLDAQAEWWWDIPLSPMAVWVVASLSFGLLLVVVTRWLRRIDVWGGERPAPTDFFASVHAADHGQKPR